MSKGSKYGSRFGRLGMAILIVVCLFVTPGTGFGRGDVGKAPASPEEKAVRESAIRYLDAEVQRDLPAVYACLAPSSVYRRTFDYGAYLAEAKASPIRIVAYKILRIAHIRGNDDLKAFPKIEKFAQVEVDIVVLFEDTKQKADVNFDFTFIKEGGQWYKG